MALSGPHGDRPDRAFHKGRLHAEASTIARAGPPRKCGAFVAERKHVMGFAFASGRLA
jgi:hypothetical protein